VTPATQQPDGETMVEATGLHTFYGASHVLHGVDLHVRRGEAVSLLGRNGMGKTTTLRTILGFVKPRRGAVRIKGRDMTGAPVHAVARLGIGYVPEGRGIFPNLTVRENLVMPARTGQDGSAHWTLHRVLELFPRLGERLDNLGNQLSGGEQQMLAIGRALMTNPEVLILDEATEGLAPLIRKEIWRVIHTIKEAGIATVIVDKNVQVLLDIADRHMILVKGSVVFDGPSEALRSEPALLERYIGV